MKMNDLVTTKVNFIHAVATVRLAISIAAEEIERMTGQQMNAARVYNQIRFDRSHAGLYFRAEGCKMYSPDNMVNGTELPKIFCHWEVDSEKLQAETEFLETLSMPGTWVEAWEKYQ